MNGHPHRLSRFLPSLSLTLGLIAATLTPVFMGLVVAVVSPVLAVAFVFAVLGAAAILRWPEIGFGVAVALSLQAIPGTWTPDIPLGFFKLKMYELAFVGSLAGVFFRHLGKSKQKGELASVARREWAWAFSTLLLITLAAIYSRYYMGNSEMVLSTTRPYLALLSIALAYQLMVDGTPWQRLDQLLWISGLLVSGIVIIQLVTGWKIMDARVEDLGLSSNTGITRSITGVGTLAQAYAIYRLSQLTSRQAASPAFRLIMAALLIVAILGLLGTFTRGAWIATAMGALVTAYVFNGWRQLFKTLIAGTVVLVMSLALTFIVNPRIGEAMVDRALSVSGEIQSGSSYDWRRQENSMAVEYISSHPLMGAGLGGAYKGGSWNGPGSFINNEFFIHNGYLGFPLFMGVFGVGLLGYFLLRMIRAILAARYSANREVASAAAGVFVVALISNIPGPVFSKFAGLLIVFLLIALIRFTGAANTESEPVNKLPQ